MNNLKLITGLTKVLSLLPFLLAATLGGLVSGIVVKGCKSEPPVQITLTPYETELSKIRAQQDSITHSVLPTYDDALRELSERYRRPR